jgi:hypothetical protein
VFSRTPYARAAKEECGPGFSTHAGQPRAQPAGREVTANLPDRLPQEIEIVRIKGALQRAEELGDDVARIRAIQKR